MYQTNDFGLSLTFCILLNYSNTPKELENISHPHIHTQGKEGRKESRIVTRVFAFLLVTSLTPAI